MKLFRDFCSFGIQHLLARASTFFKKSVQFITVAEYRYCLDDIGFVITGTR